LAKPRGLDGLLTAAAVEILSSLRSSYRVRVLAVGADERVSGRHGRLPAKTVSLFKRCIRLNGSKEAFVQTVSSFEDGGVEESWKSKAS